MLFFCMFISNKYRLTNFAQILPTTRKSWAYPLRCMEQEIGKRKKKEKKRKERRKERKIERDGWETGTQLSEKQFPFSFRSSF